LFQIDPSLYRAAVDEASANVAAAQAGAEAAAAKAQRFRPLADIEAISKQEYTDAVAQSRQAQAAVNQNAAALETARINLRFTTVPAPISGRIGRSLFTVGALVSASQTEPLAVIQRLDPIYVDMQQSSAELLALKRSLDNGGARAGATEVRLTLEDGSAYGFTGTMQFSEVAVNEATGTVTLRARFPNPRGELLPGLFVQARFERAIDPGAFLVPQQALQRDFGGDAFVFLVGPGNKAVRRKVEAKRSLGTDWVVTGGLRSGDRVIVQGTNDLKQGRPIRPVPASAAQPVAPRPPGDAPKGRG
ncbi:MAG: efflux RND transporter periplasmic adaptor subunit, partial [Novosphingobium sp.]